MIIFRNPGLIDLAAVVTMGVSVKEGENPIGRFGTGFKFGLATILRNGGRVTILRGKEECKFGIQRQQIRGKEFDLVTLDGQSLGFTTQLGIDWKPWMAFREFACNAIDEGGRYYSDMGQPECGDDETVIVAQGGGIEDAYFDRQGILLEGQPVYQNEYFEVRPGETNMIYFRGVRVGQFAKRMAFTYSILQSIELTEDRTFKWDFEVADRIGRGLLACDDRDVLRAALTCGDEYLEHSLSFPSYITPSCEFADMAGGLRAEIKDVANANPSAMRIAHERKLATLGPEQSIALEPVEKAQFERAKAMLIAAGYPIEECPITIVQELGQGIMGMAKEERIFISRAAFAKGTREVAATLIEEFAHIKSGFGDYSHGMQNWLFDQLLCQIESKAGEPF